MTLASTEIEKIARLARLQIADHELGEYTDSISSILELIDEMQQVDTAGIEPMANPLDQFQRLRPDQVTTYNQRDEFMALAPNSASGLYLVPRVIE
jgi:aspartyl-tRNA(Asn)/glutamyl-tRNA(Gln) amidotransferase subunit C